MEEISKKKETTLEADESSKNGKMSKMVEVQTEKKNPLKERLFPPLPPVIK